VVSGLVRLTEKIHVFCKLFGLLCGQF